MCLRPAPVVNRLQTCFPNIISAEKKWNSARKGQLTRGCFMILKEESRYCLLRDEISCTYSILQLFNRRLRGDVKKSCSFGWWGAWGGAFLFLLPFDAEAFKTCKNTIKLINLCALPCLGLGLWLTLTVFFDLA